MKSVVNPVSRVCTSARLRPRLHWGSGAPQRLTTRPPRVGVREGVRVVKRSELGGGQRGRRRAGHGHTIGDPGVGWGSGAMAGKWWLRRSETSRQVLETGLGARAARVVGESMSRVLRPGPASMKGLEWLARVGPSPLDPWRYAMGWSEVAARNHARRLERKGWLERCPMTRGQGSLFLATRKGILRTRAAADRRHDTGADLVGARQRLRLDRRLAHPPREDLPRTEGDPRRSRMVRTARLARPAQLQALLASARPGRLPV